MDFGNRACVSEPLKGGLDDRSGCNGTHLNGNDDRIDQPFVKDSLVGPCPRNDQLVVLALSSLCRTDVSVSASWIVGGAFSHFIGVV